MLSISLATPLYLFFCVFVEPSKVSGEKLRLKFGFLRRKQMSAVHCVNNKKSQKSQNDLSFFVRNPGLYMCRGVNKTDAMGMA